MKYFHPLLLVILLLLLPFAMQAQTAEVDSRGPHHLGDLFELSVGFGEVSWRWSVPGELQQFDIDDPTAFEIPDTLCAVTLDPTWTCPDGTNRIFSPSTVDLAYVVPQNEDGAVIEDGIARGQLIAGKFTNGKLGITAGSYDYLMFENFESGTADSDGWESDRPYSGRWSFDAEWIGNNSMWKVGSPDDFAPGGGPELPEGFTNTAVVGTMDCSYRPSADDWLKSPVVTIPDQGVNTPILTMRTWYEYEYHYDRLELYISENGFTFAYADAMVGSKSEGGWVDYSYDLTAYRGKNIRLGFRVKTDDSYHYGGWFIDQIGITNVGDPNISITAFVPGLVYGGYVAAAGLITAGIAYYSYLQVNNIAEIDGVKNYDFSTEYQGRVLEGPRDLLLVWDATNPNVSEQRKQLQGVLNMAKYHLSSESKLVFGVYDGNEVQYLNNQVYGGPQIVEGAAIDFPFQEDVMEEVENLIPGTRQREAVTEINRALLNRIYRDNNNNTDPEPEPQAEANRVIQENCLNTILFTTTEKVLNESADAVNDVKDYMQDNNFTMFTFASGALPGETDPTALSAAMEATGGFLTLAADIVGNAAEENPIVKAKEKLCTSCCNLWIIEQAIKGANPLTTPVNDTKSAQHTALVINGELYDWGPQEDEYRDAQGYREADGGPWWSLTSENWGDYYRKRLAFDTNHDYYKLAFKAERQVCEKVKDYFADIYDKGKTQNYKWNLRTNNCHHEIVKSLVDAWPALQSEGVLDPASADARYGNYVVQRMNNMAKNNCGQQKDQPGIFTKLNPSAEPCVNPNVPSVLQYYPEDNVAEVSLGFFSGHTATLRYRRVGDNTWQTVSTSDDSKPLEVQLPSGSNYYLETEVTCSTNGLTYKSDHIIFRATASWSKGSSGGRADLTATTFNDSQQTINFSGKKFETETPTDEYDQLEQKEVTDEQGEELIANTARPELAGDPGLTYNTSDGNVSYSISLADLSKRAVLETRYKHHAHPLRRSMLSREFLAKYTKQEIVDNNNTAEDVYGYHALSWLPGDKAQIPQQLIFLNSFDPLPNEENFIKERIGPTIYVQASKPLQNATLKLSLQKRIEKLWFRDLYNVRLMYWDQNQWVQIAANTTYSDEEIQIEALFPAKGWYFFAIPQSPESFSSNLNSNEDFEPGDSFARNGCPSFTATPGFHAKRGATGTIKVASDCSGGANARFLAEAPDQQEVILVASEAAPESNAFSMFPNPADGVVNLLWQDQTQSPARVSVLDMDGKLVLSQEWKEAGKPLVLQTSTFRSGMYIIRVEIADKSYTRRLVIFH